jgi:hypothetical protein
MKRFDAAPHISLGPVKIGATRAEVHDAMGAPESTFKKSATADHPTDAWFQNALQVFYTPAGMVEFIEVSGNAGIEVICFGETIFSTAAAALVARLGKTTAFTSSDGGHTFIGHDIDVALWRPEVDAPEGVHFATFGLGRSGYYA